MNTGMNTGKSWTQHEFGKIVPAMTPSEFDGLKEDIRNNGLATPGLSFEDQLLDGWHRFLIANELDIDFPTTEFVGTREQARRRVISLNIHRRHLTQEQRREVIAKVLVAEPGRANRDIAAELKVDDKLVGRVRAKLEATASLPQLDRTTGRDGKERPARASGTKAAAPTTAQPAELEPAPLSKTAQQKLNAAIRTHKRKLDSEFDEAVRQRCRAWEWEYGIPTLLKRIGELEHRLSSTRGVMTKREYNAIMRCLHPDALNARTEEQLAEAFRLFTHHKLKLVSVEDEEREKLMAGLPRNREELEAARAKVKEQRRAQREAREAAKAGKPQPGGDGRKESAPRP